MIKKMILKNFESHENSEIEFSEGLNLIIGQSNQGKSSIVRALALVVANRFDKDSVRTGADFCSVTVITNKGSVTAERGEDTNHWIVETPEGKKEYKNIGTTVPPETLSVLGMGERVRGEIKELPNIMFQLEKHYMLSEVDGKKATSNMIARMMDEAIGIGGMEELIKDIATDFGTKKKDLGTKNILISELRSGILEESIFENYKKSVQTIKDLICETEELDTLIKSSQTISEKLDFNQKRRLELNKALSVSEGIDFISDNLSQKTKQFKKLNETFAMSSNISKINKRLNSSEGIESFVNKINQKVSLIKKCQEANYIQENITKIKNRIVCDVDFDNDIFKIENNFSSIKEAEQKLKTARGLYKKIRVFLNSFIQQEKDLELAEIEFEKLKENLGVCPLCGGEL
jgi:exonuclease SbcC